MKEKLGEITEDDELKREGTLDRVGAEAKGKIGRAKDKAEDAVDAAKRTARDLVGRDDG
jgi:uncharacterized protein YjbJ (UPF0337 family)